MRDVQRVQGTQLLQTKSARGKIRFDLQPRGATISKNIETDVEAALRAFRATVPMGYVEAKVIFGLNVIAVP